MGSAVVANGPCTVSVLPARAAAPAPAPIGRPAVSLAPSPEPRRCANGTARIHRRPQRRVGRDEGAPPAPRRGPPGLLGPRRAPHRLPLERCRAHDRLLPGPPRVPVDRAVREPRLRRLDPLLLRHRPRQPARLLRLPGPRPRPLPRGARRAPPPRHLGRTGPVGAPEGQARGGRGRDARGERRLRLLPWTGRRATRAPERPARRDVRLARALRGALGDGPQIPGKTARSSSTDTPLARTSSPPCSSSSRP